MSGNRGIWPRAFAQVSHRSPLAAACLGVVMAGAIIAAPSVPVEAASPTCGPSGGHTICISIATTTISGPAIVSVTNSPNSGSIVVTWTPAGKTPVTLMQQGGPSALTGGVDYSFLWPTQKYLDATGTLRVYFGGTSNTPVSVGVSLVNGNQTQIQKSPNDWNDFLPPTTCEWNIRPGHRRRRRWCIRDDGPTERGHEHRERGPGAVHLPRRRIRVGHLHRAIQPLRHARPQR